VIHRAITPAARLDSLEYGTFSLLADTVVVLRRSTR
jgi:hypothetical protein